MPFASTDSPVALQPHFRAHFNDAMFACWNLKSIIMNALFFPGIDLTNLYQFVLTFFFSSLRISAMLISMPFFSTSFIPLQVRIVLSMCITFFIFETIKLPNLMEMSVLSIFIIILAEIGLGLSVGFILNILFSAASVSGEKIASTAGLSMANMVDPQSGGQTLVISTVLSLFLISIFLSLDGHLFLIKMIIESYNYLPIGESLNFREVSNAGIFAFGRMLYLGSLIMLPVVGGMLLINLAGGIITRSAPTLNLFSFIFPITLIGVFIFLYLALGTIANAFSDLVGISINLIDNVLHSNEYK